MVRKRPGEGSNGAARDVLERVSALARNLWWTWNPEAQRLFASLEPREWEATNHNPLATLARLGPERRGVLRADPGFHGRVAAVEQSLSEYLAARTWYAKSVDRPSRSMLVAYFCAEFALHESVPLYSGGLGVLAGDHLKSASDLGVPLVAVGLLYHHGYYRQELRLDGTTRVVHPRVELAALPITDTGKRIKLRVGRAKVQVKIWRCQVGRVPLYLLDTDTPDNPPAVRALSHELYGGDNLYRIQQEVLLGIGGMLALDELGIAPSVYHLNEGHAAFCALELLRRFRERNLQLEPSIEAVRGRVVFTSHTPVEAGHDRFSPERALEHLGEIGRAAKLTPGQLLGLGRVHPEDEDESFCMTVLALKLANWVNGVSELHGKVTRTMWKGVYGVPEQDVPIGHVTNGVHSQTWLAPEAVPFYEKHLRPGWVGAGPRGDWWAKATEIPRDELWRLRTLLRRRLVAFIRQRLRDQLLRSGAPAEEVAEACAAFHEDALTIGFARRFATYKRAPLLFKDRRRLVRLLSDPARPVQIVFAGKAHPADIAGQEYVRRIYEQTRTPELRGRLVLIEDYDMHVGRMLTSGCDVWLNNPLRPMEASGTSGMKPPLHGGLNCSVLDGWWPEAYDGQNGWDIGGGVELPTQERQDVHDARSLYETLEKQIIPSFFERDGRGIPRRWLRMAARSMQTVCADFSAHRMLGEYVEQYYTRAHAVSSGLVSPKRRRALGLRARA